MAWSFGSRIYIHAKHTLRILVFGSLWSVFYFGRITVFNTERYLISFSF